MVKKGKKLDDPAWDHCTKVNPESRMHLRCNYCNGTRWGGVFRMKQHLAGTHSDTSICEQVPEEVRQYFQELLCANAKKTNSMVCSNQSRTHMDDECFQGGDESGSVGKGKGMDRFVTKSKGKQLTMNEVLKKDREPACRDIMRFFYKNALSFNLVKCPTFKKMMGSVGDYGKGLKLPSYHEARVTYLKKEVESVHKTLEDYKKEWKKTGCTLMSDGWSDGKSRHLTNFLVNSPMGTVFLKSVDTSSFIKDAKKLFEMLDEMIDEIGEENVVQVVTDSTSAYVAAGRLLEEKRERLFWNPCTAHLLNLMLDDIGQLSVFKETIEKAREVTVYIYRHNWVLSMYRRFAMNNELTRAGATRFATNFLTLKSFAENKVALRSMFTSLEWINGPYALKVDAQKVEGILLADGSFWKAIQYCLKAVHPLYKVLRLVDGDAKPAMGYIYEAMDRAKEQIAINFGHVVRRYSKIWKIIDLRWDLQVHRPLHAAGYYLNPKFFYGDGFKADKEVKRGLYETLERMCPDTDAIVLVQDQMEHFKTSSGMLGGKTAIATRDKKQPATWWDDFGEDVPELQDIARRVLSLTCSATGCERNWSTFDHVHSKKRNRLEAQRLNALVFVKYNLQLELRKEKRKENPDFDPISLSDMDDDDEWITPRERDEPCLPTDHSWMDVHECFQEGPSNKRKRGPRNLNKGKGKGKQVVDDDDIEILEDEELEDEDGEEVEVEDRGNSIVIEDEEDDDDDVFGLDETDDRIE